MGIGLGVGFSIASGLERSNLGQVDGGNSSNSRR